MATDPTYTTSGLVSWADVLLLMYLDVLFFGTVKFWTMFSILACNFCGVIETLVSVQTHVHNPTCILLNKVGSNEVNAIVGEPKAVEVSREAVEDKAALVVDLLDVMVVVGGGKVVGGVCVFAVEEVSCEDKELVFVCVLDVVVMVGVYKVLLVVCEVDAVVEVGVDKV